MTIRGSFTGEHAQNRVFCAKIRAGILGEDDLKNSHQKKTKK